MPGLMRRTMSYLGLVEDFDDEYDEDEYDPRVRDADRDGGRAPETRVERSLTAVDRHQGPAPRVVEPTRADLSRITTVHPRTYNDARTIGERYRDGTPVIMNLTEMDDTDAKRLVDFSAGLIFGRRGSIDRVTSKVFLLSPPDVEVTAEDKARIVEGGFYNQS